ncbi:MAG: class C sortase [Lachnospiraceae bacterium]|nr:class C sortase [Lachnospiraceae bacterium]
MKDKKTTILLVIVFFIGLSLLLYPSLSEYWNSFHQTRAIAVYTDKVAKMDENQYEEVLESAYAYNAYLAENKTSWFLTEEEKEVYEQQLNVVGNGIMGYIEIPSIHCSLPIYHGTNESVLQIATGHIEGSSLPVGGPGTHCAISGHRGLPSAKLFTDLDKLKEGDYFVIQVLNEQLTYEVDQIRIVEPDNVTDLVIEKEKDLCTLITCTPYGINSHRLLIRGSRTDNRPDEYIPVTADAVQIEPRIIAPILAIPILLILLIWVFASSRKGKDIRKGAG